MTSSGAPTRFPPLLRQTDSLFGGRFDLLVVGGGIAGAVAAWDAALRGLRVALVEAHDFGSGASANNLKLLHGGLRYLKRLEVRDARAAVAERRSMLRIAPHIVAPMPVLVPTYGWSWQNRVFVRTLTGLSDLAAWDRNRGLTPERMMPSTRMLSRREVLGLAPELDHQALSGGALIPDAQVASPERLVLGIVRAAAEAGAVVANYVMLEAGVLEQRQIIGARLRDQITGNSGEIHVRGIINATGGAAPTVIQRLLRRPPRWRPRYSLAFNVVVPERGLPVAVALPTSGRRSGGGRRQLLRVPWRGRELIGTMHLPSQDGDDRVRLQESELASFLDDFNRAHAAAAVRLDDVLLVHAGLLPLDDRARAGEVRLLRRHRIVDHTDDGAAGAVSLISVKYTTGRLAAEHAVDAVVARTGMAAGPCRTATTPLPIAPHSPADLLTEAVRLHGHRLPADVLEHLIRSHGTAYAQVLQHRDHEPGWEKRVEPGSPVIQAELVHGVRDEMARSAADLVWRRTELGPRGSASAAVLKQAARVIEAELTAPERAAPGFAGPPWSRRDCAPNSGNHGSPR